MTPGSERVKAWRLANPERAKQLKREWAARWRARNPGADGVRNADKHREYVKRSEQLAKLRDPEGVRAKKRMYNAARRAKLRGAFVEYVDRRIVLERSMGLCGICGLAVDFDCFDVDHILPLAKGGKHSYANTQATHPSCNRRKGGRS